MVRPEPGLEERGGPALSAREVVDLALRIADVVIWPVVVLLIAFSFRRTIRDRISQSEEVAFTGFGGIGISAKGRLQAADALIRASQPTGTIDREEAVEQVSEVVRTVGDFGRPPRILWVDDRPSNNTYE